MKPTKNKVFCNNCDRIKMLFDTEKKAEIFMKFNNEEIESVSGYSPKRSYYCLFCGGWHTTSIKEQIGLSKKEQLLFNREKENKTNIVNKEEIKIKKISEVEDKIKDLDSSKKEIFFSENISILTQEIEILNSDTDKEKLKELRQNLEILYIVRNKNGFKKINNKFEEARKKEIEEWSLWANKIGY
jgi:hypothetical protein